MHYRKHFLKEEIPKMMQENEKYWFAVVATKYSKNINWTFERTERRREKEQTFRGICWRCWSLRLVRLTSTEVIRERRFWVRQHLHQSSIVDPSLLLLIFKWSASQRILHNSIFILSWRLMFRMRSTFRLYLKNHCGKLLVNLIRPNIYAHLTNQFPKLQTNENV